MDAKNYFCIGNFAIDHQYHSTFREVLVGGAAYRFCLGWSLYGLGLDVITSIGDEDHWKEPLNILLKNNIYIEPQKTHHSIRFETYYDEGQRISSFHAFNTENMSQLASAGLNMNLGQYKWAHIAPFNGIDQLKLIQHASSNGCMVSSMIHYSSLSEDTRELYLKALENLDVLFLNEHEASFLIDKPVNEWQICGCILSAKTKGIVFLTLAERGSSAFMSGNMVAYCPPVELNVVNTLGAGDHFSGGALAGWITTNNPLLALRYGSMSASFSIAGKTHQSLLHFLDSSKIP